ncbi:MAG: PilZ domain-containing protein, partial [Desulfobacterales bacterium]|nr:PilZ domain-containing protein [Desulfobacterales bacterium]
MKKTHMETDATVEKRNQARSPFAHWVHYECRDKVCRGLARNIGYDGVFIETPQRLEPGESICITFHFPSCPFPIRLTGEIIRGCPQGIAVRFDRNAVPQEAVLSPRADAAQAPLKTEAGRISSATRDEDESAPTHL